MLNKQEATALEAKQARDTMLKEIELAREAMAAKEGQVKEAHDTMAVLAAGLIAQHHRAEQAEEVMARKEAVREQRAREQEGMVLELVEHVKRATSLQQGVIKKTAADQEATSKELAGVKRELATQQRRAAQAEEAQRATGERLVSLESELAVQRRRAAQGETEMGAMKEEVAVHKQTLAVMKHRMQRMKQLMTEADRTVRNLTGALEAADAEIASYRSCLSTDALAGFTESLA